MHVCVYVCVCVVTLNPNSLGTQNELITRLNLLNMRMFILTSYLILALKYAMLLIKTRVEHNQWLHFIGMSAFKWELNQ